MQRLQQRPSGRIYSASFNHPWLDAFAGIEEYGFRHRKKRHHQQRIKEVVRLFGEEARDGLTGLECQFRM